MWTYITSHDGILILSYYIQLLKVLARYYAHSVEKDSIFPYNDVECYVGGAANEVDLMPTCCIGRQRGDRIILGGEKYRKWGR